MKQRGRWAILAAVAGLLVLDLAAIGVYRRENGELDAVITRLVRPDDPPSETMRRLTRYLASDVPVGRLDDYFLLPVFRPLKPTALQVIHGKGDCAYKARSLIVMLRRLGIHASKVALYDKAGNPAHAVVVTDTERGPFVSDVLYGVVYEYPDGAPIPLAELGRNEPLFREEVAEEAREGNLMAAQYPFQKYPISQPRTMNWDKFALLRFARAGLSAVLGDSAVDTMPRPFITEEPALMVLTVSMVAKLLLLLLFAALGGRGGSRVLNLPEPSDRTLGS